MPILVGLLLGAAPGPMLSAFGAEPVSPCTLESGPVATVSRVLDGETLVLDTGRAVRLIGALAPRARDAGAESGAWPPETAAMRFLQDLVLGKKVRLGFGDRHTDRYGRFLAQVFVEDGRERGWVQGELLATGHARAYGLPGNFTCVTELLAHETQAREMRHGLWGNGVYRTLAAERPGVLMALRGKYVRVVGEVITAGVAKSATYLNFGTDRRSDFTARIDRRVLTAHPAWAKMLQGLDGKRVALRGWIERRNGPLIEINDPSQLEILDGDDAPGLARAPSATEPASVTAEDPIEPDVDDPADAAKNLRPVPPEDTEPGALNL